MNASIMAIVISTALAGAAGPEPLRFDFSPSPLERFLKQAEPKRTVVCPPCKTPPKIDGLLDDAAWRDAGRIDRLIRPQPSTRTRLCFDDRALYIAVECSGKHGPEPAGAPSRDGPDLWKNEHVEIWIDPAGQGKVRYQFVVGIRGSTYDGIARTGANDQAYDPDWTHAVKLGEGGWQFEAAIPLEAVRLKRWHRQIGFNIGRNAPAIGPRCWNPSHGDTTEGALILKGAPERPPAAPEEPAAAAEKRETIATGDALHVTLERTFARPGERWIEAGLVLSPRVPLEKTRIRARLFRVAGTKPAAELSTVPIRNKGTLLIDLRRQGMTDAEVSVELFEGTARTGAAKAFVSARDCRTPLRPGQKVAVDIDLPTGIDNVVSWPVTFGVPFPAGALWDVKSLRLVDVQGREIPSQKEATGLWAREGAIQWVRFDALLSSKGACFVQAAAPTDASRPSTPVRVAEHADRVILETGVARYVLAKGASPIREVWLGGQRIATSEHARGLYVVDQSGRLASASADGETMEIEARGPVAACVRFEGFYRTAAGEQLARHITRVEVFAGQPFAKITHTLTLTNDTNKVWFKDIGWEFAVSPGANPKAVFGVSREEWAKSLSQPLDGRGASAFMLQDEHYVFAHGKNHFSVAAYDAGGEEAKVLLEGAECGDWAVLSGSRGAFAVSCREAARQHPKEFEVFRDRIVLHLFSSRGGEELDFRAPALVKKWDLANWYDHTQSKNYRDKTKQEEQVKKFTSNAIGWARTHELLVSPLGPSQPGARAARLAKLHKDPAYGHVDPPWICKTEVVGRIHPRDPKRFPRAEKVIEETFRVWERRVDEWGDYGFVDYFAGPHLGYRGKYARPYRYCPYTYTLRGDLWRIYARSGDRRIRALAEGTNRAYMDNILAHWDGNGKVRGLYVSPHGTDAPMGNNKGCLPFYWEGSPGMEISSSSDLYQFLWFYHMSGYRRAKDIVLEYADGMKRWWTPAKARRCGRAIMAMRLLAQAYGLTWDPELRALADGTTDVLADPQGAIGLTKKRAYGSSTYKTQVDIAGFLDAWNILGAPRYRELCMKISNFWWRSLLGKWPIFYCNPQGRIGNFLYRETGDPAYVQGLMLQMRQAATAYDPEKKSIIGSISGHVGAEASTFVFQGIPYAEDLIVRTGADKAPAASWVGYDDYGYQTSLVAHKASEDTLELDLKGATRGEGVRLRPVRPSTSSGMNLNYIVQRSDDSVTAHVPRDAPEGDYEITWGETGTGPHFALAHTRTPLVVHAPKYWQPEPTMAPPARWYFELPENSRDAQIFFEDETRLFDPKGEALQAGKPVHGWIDLPGDRPGLWSFEPVKKGLVRVRNVPPFFAAGDPQSYFTPKISWQREAMPPPPQEVPKETVYVPGAIHSPGNQALNLAGRRKFTLKAGPRHTSGDGGRFLPFQQGTIEFFVKPTQGTFDLPVETTRYLLKIQSARENWHLDYHKSPKRNWWLLSHVLYGYFMTEGPMRRCSMRTYRQTILDRDKWVHVAWVWGKQERGMFISSKARRVLRTRIFVNGKGGRQYGYQFRPPEQSPADRPVALQLGYTFDGFYDELRISDVQRYTGDFTPPSRDQELKLDEHTRALFHFNGNVKGKSHGYKGALPVELK